MDKPINNMDKSTSVPVYRSENFRTPLAMEKKLGLWVDRIGSATMDTKIPGPNTYRMLGLYGVVNIDRGAGFYHDIDGKKPVRQGDTMLLFPERPSLYYPDNRWDTRWIVWFGPEALRLEEMGFLDQQRPVLRGVREIVNDAHASLQKILFKEDIVSILERKQIVLSMLHDLFIATRGGENESVRIVRKAIQLIKSSYDNEYAVPEIAAQCNMSVTHFRRVFKKHTGRSPKEFMIAHRISRAKEYLALGKPIKEIADSLGYEDIFYFMRVFKKYAGCSPGDFQKRHCRTCHVPESEQK